MARKLQFTYTQFKTIYSKTTRLCVDILIKNEKGILLILRKKNGWLNQWHFPGGMVFYREKIIDTVHRIANEELGVEVKIQKNLGYIEYFSELKERGFGYSVSIVFLCRPLNSNFILDDITGKVKYFNTIPNNTVIEQKDFIVGMLKYSHVRH